MHLLSLPALLLPVLQGAPAPSWTQADLERVSAEIQAQVETLRGAKFQRPVQVRLTDAKGLREYVALREKETMTPERIHRDEAAAKLLGLVAPDLDLRAKELEILEGQVGGFYDPGSDTFFLMQGLEGGLARVILSHELTHALDDQLYDLDAVLKRAREETDAELAFRSVCEGSGSNAMNRWTVQHQGELTAADYAKIQEMGAEALASAPPYLWKPMLASYMAGEGFLVRTRGLNLTLKAAGAADVERAFREPPRSMEQVLHPEKYWDAEKRDEPVALAIDAAALPAGWSKAGEDTLGELVLALLATPPADRKGIDTRNPMSIVTVKYTNGAAEGWGGDRLALLARGEDRFLQLVTVWDTPKDAEEFEKALAESAPKVWKDARDPAAGWRPGFAPTGWSVTRGRDGEGPAWVVVRAWSVADAADRSAESVLLPWKVVAAEKGGKGG